MATDERRVEMPHFSYAWPKKNAERGRANSAENRRKRWRVCSIGGCNNAYWGYEGGMCRPHYVQTWEKGQTTRGSK